LCRVLFQLAALRKGPLKVAALSRVPLRVAALRRGPRQVARLVLAPLQAVAQHRVPFGLRGYRLTCPMKSS
jgi:hypothetical protein